MLSCPDIEKVDMNLSPSQYQEYCKIRSTKEVSILCDTLNKIKNKTAEELLVTSNQLNNTPVDLEKILEAINISCLPYDFKDDGSILGACVASGNQAAIFYRKDEIEDSHRYRFTIAHEIAHCCLGHINPSAAPVHYRKTGDLPDEEERAANVFAGELLIPKDSLLSVISKLYVPSVKTIAQVFAVSENVMKERLKFLGIDKWIKGYNF